MLSEPGKINFPLYSVTPLSCNHVIVTGGGGSANTGVFNGFAICEIGYENNGYTACETQRLDAGSVAVMNCAVGSFNNGKRIFLAAGKNADCYIYQVKLGTKNSSDTSASSTHSDGSGEATTRKRNTANGDAGSTKDESPASASRNSPKQDPLESAEFVFDIKPLQFVQTDFSQGDPYQNTVVFTHDSRLVLTGGADGVLRVWNFPEMQLKSKIEVSKKEIADVDVSPDRKYVACVSKDGKCKIWTLSDGKLNLSLDLPPEDEGRFLYKRAKFGVVEDKRNTYRLFGILNPTNYKQDKSYLQHWTGPSFSLTKVAVVGEMLSALALSRCGKYLAVGSMTNGDVDIYVSFSLQRIKHVAHAHKTFVTGLAFLPPAQSNEESVLANCDAAVVSVSIDNQIRVHHVERTTGISMWMAVMLVVLVLLATFILCSYLNF